MQSTSSKNNMLIVEVVVVITLIVGGYFGYTTFFVDATSTTQVAANVKLGKNMSAFVQAVGKKGNINLDIVAITSSPYVKSLQDHTQVFTYSTRRGRLDPFLPYDSTRPIR